MKYQLPKQVQQIQPYQPVQGEYAIRLDANESYFNLQPQQWEEIQTQLQRASYHRYPDPYAVEVCQQYAKLYDIDPDAIVAGNGSDELIGLLAGVFFEKQDKVAVFANDFSMYRLYMEIYGVDCVTLPKRADLTVDVEATIQAINEQGITALIFSNPCNPTSLGMKREDVLHLIESVDALIVLDEAYMDFWDQSLLDVATDYPNLMILKTCSKAIGLAGIRLGFAISNPTLVTAMKATKAPYNLNHMTQIVGKTMLQDKAYLQQAADALVAGTKQLYQELCELSEQTEDIETVYPTCTNFVFLKTPKAKQWHTALLEASISIRFMGDYLRISCGSPEENQQLMQVLRQIVLGEN